MSPIEFKSQTGDKMKSFLATFYQTEANRYRKVQFELRIDFNQYHFFVTLVDALELFESVLNNIKQIRGKSEFLDKFDRVVARNKVFQKMKEI